MSWPMRERAVTLGDDWQPTASGILVPPRPKRRYSGRPLALDLFCGAGGFTLGFIEGGFEVVGGLDNDPVSALAYLSNLGNWPMEIHCVEPADKQRLQKSLERTWPAKEGEVYQHPVAGMAWKSAHPEHPGVSHFFFGDCRRWTGEEILDALGLEVGELDCIFGGPPCQGFSKGGRREVMDPRNSLVFEFARLVCEIRPKFFCLENVPGILSMVTPEGVPVVDAMCRIFEDGGFGGFDALKRTLLETAGCGAALHAKPKPRLKKDDADDEEPEQEEAPQLALVI
jgi:DNA (cytosine-5)-methyltransferase 1